MPTENPSLMSDAGDDRMLQDKQWVRRSYKFGVPALLATVILSALVYFDERATASDDPLAGLAVLVIYAAMAPLVLGLLVTTLSVPLLKWRVGSVISGIGFALNVLGVVVVAMLAFNWLSGALMTL